MAGGEIRESGARSLGMGGAGTALSGDLWSAMGNPALLSELNPSVSAAWNPGRFGLTELSSVSLAGAVKYGNLGFGAAIVQFGSTLYREYTSSAAASIRLAQHIQLGMQVNIYSLSIDRYGSTVLPYIDLGAAVQVLPSMRIAVSAGNVTNTAIEGYITDRLPVTLRLGSCWMPDSNIVLLAEIDKDMRWPVNTRVGAEYRIFEAVFFRAGATMQPWTASGGFGVQVVGLRFDYAYCWHPDLAETHAFGIGITL